MYYLYSLIEEEMVKDEAINTIRKIVKEKIGNSYNYRLFLFGENINYKNQSKINFDVGIDCDFCLSINQKLQIIDELDSYFKTDDLMFLDFSNLNKDLKSRVFKNCEFIN